jgi:hypothetical protein
VQNDRTIAPNLGLNYSFFLKKENNYQFKAEHVSFSDDLTHFRAFVCIGTQFCGLLDLVCLFLAGNGEGDG